MKLFRSIAIALLLIPVAVWAAPKNWTLPATLYTDGVTTLSGTFTYDETTGLVTNPNIVASGSDAAAVNQNFNFPGDPSTQFAFFQNAQTVSGSPICFVIVMAGSDTAQGTYTAPFLGLYYGGSLPNGLCTASGPEINGGNGLPSVVLTTPVAAPTPIPTLSEWAMIIMASLMAMFAIGRMRRQ